MSLPDDSARKSRCESISSIRHPLGCARANTRTLPHQPASAIRTQLSPACSVLACDMCASRFTTLMSAPLGPMGISRSTSSCALSRRYRRYSTVPPSTSSWRSHGISMVSRWYLDGISIGISIVSRRPHGALTMASASSAACSCSRRNGTINGHAPGFFHSRG